MICTECFTDDEIPMGIDDCKGLTVDQIVLVCGNWRCPACLTIAERDEAERSADNDVPAKRRASGQK